MELFNTISNNRTWNRHGVKIAWALALLCLLLVILSIAWDARTQSKLKTTNYTPQEVSPIKQRQKQTYRVDTILAANLFGDSTPAPVQEVITKTTLNLKLQGILWASDDTIARAIITSGSKKAELYSVGEEIKGSGASVREIRDTEVILDRNGASESLAMDKKYKSDQSLISYANNSQADQRDAEPAVMSLNDIKTENPAPANEQRKKIRKPNFSGLDRALKKMGEI